MTQASSEPWIEPFGRFAFAEASAVRTASMPTFILLSSSGFISTRTPGRELPPTKTWPMPSICAIFWARMESPTSYICGCVMTSEVMARIMIGASAGLTLRQFGFDGRFAGSCPRAALIAACTSRAAASMSRSSSNCSVTLVDPEELFEVICVTPAMRPNCRSSGVATAEAIVCGSAPGSDAETEIVGNSTCGKGATGSSVYASAPLDSCCQLVKPDVHDRRGIQREELADEQSADDRDA